MWIPTDIGIPGNELVDELATRPVRPPDIEIYPYVTDENVIHTLKIECNFTWHTPHNQWGKRTNETDGPTNIEPDQIKSLPKYMSSN